MGRTSAYIKSVEKCSEIVFLHNFLFMYHVEIMSVEQKVSIIIGVYDEMVWGESLNPILLIWTTILTCGNNVCINI